MFNHRAKTNSFDLDNLLLTEFSLPAIHFTVAKKVCSGVKKGIMLGKISFSAI
jgi:hypothetical protein